MKTLLGSLVLLSLGLAACGGQQQKDQVAGDAERVSFNDEVKAALASESSSLPAAMIVKVPLAEDGKEDPALAEVRAARVASSNVVSTWESAEKAESPSDTDTFVVVNPQEAAAASQTVAALQDRYPYRGDDVVRTENNSTNTAANEGNNGLIVTGSNNYTYFNQINTSSNLNNGQQDLDLNARYYGYNVRPGIHHRGCGQARWCNDYGWGGYYRYAYRPVYRSWNYGFGGYNGYWGYFSNPYRYVKGRHCYYVYGRPAVYGASVSASSFGWQY